MERLVQLSTFKPISVTYYLNKVFQNNDYLTTSHKATRMINLPEIKT